MSTKTRIISTRRDRRKAKQSEFRREGRSNPKKVGHGGSGQGAMGQIDIASSVEQESNAEHFRRTTSRAFATIGEILWWKSS